MLITYHMILHYVIQLKDIFIFFFYYYFVDLISPFREAIWERRILPANCFILQWMAHVRPRVQEYDRFLPFCVSLCDPKEDHVL